jgi:formylglycine-generating enzyme required for sulfatase activity
MTFRHQKGPMLRLFLALICLPLLVGCAHVGGGERPPAPDVQRPTAAGAAFRDCAACPEMVVIPAGRFMMGSAEGEADRFYNEGPQHEVTLPSFALGKYEVTQQEWIAVMGSYGGYLRGDTLPAENVTWPEVQTFVQTLNAKTGKRYRLPTEAEWEYAARAGAATAYPGGDTPARLGDYAWHAENSGGFLHPVGEKMPNGFGLHDIYGSLWEWVEDCYAESYDNAPADGGAAPEVHGCSRIIRGGSWYNLPVFLRAANRFSSDPDYRYFYRGFRVALTLP